MDCMVGVSTSGVEPGFVLVGAHESTPRECCASKLSCLVAHVLSASSVRLILRPLKTGYSKEIDGEVGGCDIYRLTELA